MPVRKTETRIPAGLQAEDLGQSTVAADGRCTLVSMITSPLVIARDAAYVVFVTDAALAGSVQSFEWTFTENGGAPTTRTTDDGTTIYAPQASGSLEVRVRLLDAANAEQGTLAVTQDVVGPSVELESLIDDAADESGPGVANPDVARELVNDHNPYYQAVAPKTPEPPDAFRQFVFGTVFDGALRREPAQRAERIQHVAASLNGTDEDFLTQSAEGIGVSGIRLVLLGMTFGSPSPLLPWTEFPERSDQRIAAEEKLRETLAALDETDRIDLFNIARFPKSNITQCARILEALRDRYFPGTSFADVLGGMSGTRALWITRQFREGPLTRS